MQKLVTEVRRFRSDQGLADRQKVPARLSGVDERRSGHPGRRGDVAGVADRARPGIQPVGVAGGRGSSGGTVVVELDTSGTIDVAAERRRLEKDLAAAQKELASTTAKLGNADFMAKAPEAVVDKIRERQRLAQRGNRADHAPVGCGCNDRSSPGSDDRGTTSERITRPHAGRDRVAAAGRAPARPALAGDQDRAEPDPDHRADGPAGLATTAAIRRSTSRAPTARPRWRGWSTHCSPRCSGAPGAPPARTCNRRWNASRSTAKPISPAQYVATYREIEPFVQMVDAAVAGGRRARDEQVRGAHRDGVRRVRGRPGRRRGGRGGDGGTLGCHQRDQRAGRGDHPDQHRPCRIPR